MKTIDIRKGDQFGYVPNRTILVQVRGNDVRTCRHPLDEFRRTSSDFSLVPVTDSVARAVLAATGYTVVDVPEETRVEWPTHAIYDSELRVIVYWGSEPDCKSLCNGLVARKVIPIPGPPPHPTVVAAFAALAKWMGPTGSDDGCKLRTAAQAVVDAGGTAAESAARGEGKQ